MRVYIDEDYAEGKADETRALYHEVNRVHNVLSALEDEGFEVHLIVASGRMDTPCFEVTYPGGGDDESDKENDENETFPTGK